MQLKAGDAQAQRVLAFWFDGPGGSERGRVRSRWFGKDPAFDQEIRDTFGALIERALSGGCEHWALDPDTAPALVIVLDQFTRNVFRDTPKMFAGDAAALAVARRIVADGWDRRYDPLLRWFCYLPFEHSESLEDQRESLRLFGQLRDDPLAGGAWSWAVRHYEVVERFGRYPHRNAILGRESTPAEEAFLREPGSRF
ncbi:MAG: DUF924 domain-containing protein [Burkholderiaceae bacterium]|nr:DUF924 domain-containing protein [Burkholderiaceae bacterium]